MSPARGYRFRAPSRTDLEAVTALLIADQLTSGDTVTLDSDFLESGWSRPDFDFAQDAWVIVGAGDLVVGYGMVAREDAGIVRSWGMVHSDHRGRGLGSALLDRIEGRAQELLVGIPDQRHRHAINAGDTAAEQMLAARGLQVLRHMWHMQLDLHGPVTPGPEPGASRIAPIAHPDDLPAVHDVLDAAFAEDPSHHPEPFDSWAEEEAKAPGFDPSLWLLAHEGGRPVGTLTASIQKEVAWIDYVCVLSEARRHGIGAGLLRRAFANFAERGIRTVRLSVDAQNPTGATALYERVGMRVVRAWDLWERVGEPPPRAVNSPMIEASTSTA